MRGISEIIAVILMLMIVVGLAGTAFIYIQSSLTGRTTKQIDIVDVSCANPGASATVYVTVKNFDPKLSIVANTTSSELLVYMNSAPVSGPQTWTGSGTCSNATASIPNGASCTGSFTCPVCASGSSIAVKVVGPSNTVEKSTTC